MERLDVRHAAALLEFELENRAYFAKSISDRGDAYFARFGEDLAERLAEQETGVCLFHVLRATGFVPVGEVMLPGRRGLRHERSLAP